MSRLVPGALLVTTVVLLASCSGEAEPADVFTGPYASQLRNEYEAATDPEIKETLRDGRISRAEYDAAVQRYVACAADQGVTITPHERYGLYTYEVVGLAAVESVIDGCDPVIQTIESLYSSMVTNPQNIEPMDVIAECLARSGLVPRDYSGDDLTSDMENRTEPFDVDSPDFDRCFINPQADG